MSPNARDPSDPLEWLRRARSNLARATAGPKSRDILYEDLCFDAQQAAEKAIKAVLVARQVEFPKTHSIGDLLAILQEDGLKIPLNLRKATILTDYAVEARYPGTMEPVTKSEHRNAVAIAGRIVKWAEGRVGRKEKETTRGKR